MASPAPSTTPVSKAKGFSIVVAVERNGGIGWKGQLPWKLAGDMRFFRELTRCPDRAAVEKRYGLLPGGIKIHRSVLLQDFQAHLKASPDLPLPRPDWRNAVLMGRRTWEGLPPAFKPLSNRLNAVLSRNAMTGKAGRDDKNDTHQVWGSLDEAIAHLLKAEDIQEIFVIGGAQLYVAALNHPECERIYLTAIERDFPCDAFFPEIPASFLEAATSETIEEEGTRYHFRLLQRETK